MMGGILSRYLSKQFLKTIIAIFLGVFILIFSIDYLEMSRRMGDIEGVSSVFIFQLSLFRSPAIAEQVFPFAVLFGSMVTLLQLSRKLELVIARSAGISAWQFLQPGIIVALILGIISVCAFNPLSAFLKKKALSMEAEISSGAGKAVASETIWFRQILPEGYAIIQANGILFDAPVLTGITVFVFTEDGQFKERIEAREGILHKGKWELKNVDVVSSVNEPQSYEVMELPSNLKASQLHQSFASADSVPFWNLREMIRQTEKSGLDGTRYRLQFISLLMRPLLFVAMVLVAASVSLRFFRFGGITKLVLGGIFAGFFLYVATQLVQELGSSGLLNPWIAAGTPVCIGGLLGTLALLYQEDG